MVTVKKADPPQKLVKLDRSAQRAKASAGASASASSSTKTAATSPPVLPPLAPAEPAEAAEPAAVARIVSVDGIGPAAGEDPLPVEEELVVGEVTAESYETLPMSVIYPDWAWNLRSGKWDMPGASPEPETEDGTRGKDHFSAFCANIATVGQKDCIDVVPSWDKKEGKPYRLVEGYRRFRAFIRIYKEGRTVPGIPEGHIKVRILQMGEGDSREHNIRAACMKDKVSHSDLAWAIGDLVRQKPYLTDGVLSAMFGKSSNYVGMLRRIQTRVSPRITAAWRKCEDLTGRGPVELNVLEMREVSRKETPQEMVEAYTQFVNDRRPQIENAEPEDGLRYLVAARKKAERIGDLLGRMVNAELFHPAIQKLEEDVGRWETILMTSEVRIGTRLMVPTKRQIKQVVQAMLNSYLRARDRAEPGGSEDEDE